MYIRGAPQFTKTPIEKALQLIDIAITHAFIIIFLFVTTDFIMRCENSYANAFGPIGETRRVADSLAAVLKNCSIVSHLSVSFAPVDVQMTAASAPLTLSSMTNLISSILIIAGIQIIVSAILKYAFAYNVQYLRIRGLMIPFTSLLACMDFAVSVALVSTIAATDSTRMFLKDYVDACASQLRVTDPIAFYDSDVDTDTLFGTNLWPLLAIAAINTAMYVFQMGLKVYYYWDKAEVAMALANHPYLKGSFLCIPRDPLLLEYNLLREAKLAQIRRDYGMVNPAFQPLLTGEYLDGDGHNFTLEASLTLNDLEDRGLRKTVVETMVEAGEARGTTVLQVPRTFVVGPNGEIEYGGGDLYATPNSHSYSKMRTRDYFRRQEQNRIAQEEANRRYRQNMGIDGNGPLGGVGAGGGTAPHNTSAATTSLMQNPTPNSHPITPHTAARREGIVAPLADNVSEFAATVTHPDAPQAGQPWHPSDDEAARSDGVIDNYFALPQVSGSNGFQQRNKSPSPVPAAGTNGLYEPSPMTISNPSLQHHVTHHNAFNPYAAGQPHHQHQHGILAPGGGGGGPPQSSPFTNPNGYGMDTTAMMGQSFNNNYNNNPPQQQQIGLGSGNGHTLMSNTANPQMQQQQQGGGASRLGSGSRSPFGLLSDGSGGGGDSGGGVQMAQQWRDSHSDTDYDVAAPTGDGGTSSRKEKKSKKDKKKEKKEKKRDKKRRSGIADSAYTTGDDEAEAEEMDLYGASGATNVSSPSAAGRKLQRDGGANPQRQLTSSSAAGSGGSGPTIFAYYDADGNLLGEGSTLEGLDDENYVLAEYDEDGNLVTIGGDGAGGDGALLLDGFGGSAEGHGDGYHQHSHHHRHDSQSHKGAASTTTSRGVSPSSKKKEKKEKSDKKEKRDKADKRDKKSSAPAPSGRAAPPAPSPVARGGGGGGVSNNGNFISTSSTAVMGPRSLQAPTEDGDGRGEDSDDAPIAPPPVTSRLTAAQRDTL